MDSRFQESPYLGKTFFSILYTSLSRVVGPMAKLLIIEAVREMGCAIQSVPVSHAPDIVGWIARAICNEDKRRQFEKIMQNVIAQMTVNTVHPQTVVKKPTYGKSKQLLDTIMFYCAKGDPGIVEKTKNKLKEAGLAPGMFTAQTRDDPKLFEELIRFAKNEGVPDYVLPTVSYPPSNKVSIGKCRQLIDAIVFYRSKGDKQIARTIKLKLGRIGINSKNFSWETPDDPVTLKKLVGIAKHFGVFIYNYQLPVLNITCKECGREYHISSRKLRSMTARKRIKARCLDCGTILPIVLM